MSGVYGLSPALSSEQAGPAIGGEGEDPAASTRSLLSRSMASIVSALLGIVATLEYFDHFVEDITFGDVVADANGAGSKVVGTELLGEPVLGHLLAFAAVDEAKAW
jgi:hypothetical protein